MQYRTLGKTGMSVSVVGIGTWQFGGEWGKDFDSVEVGAMLEKCRELGINLIDTAECYGDHTSEAFIGEAIARDRDNWIVATKFGHRFYRNFERTTDFSVNGMRAQLEASLKALRSDYVDVYQVHGVAPETFDDDELWEALAEQKALGKVRAIGVSIGNEAMPLGRDDVETVQVIYNRLNREAVAEILPAAEQKNLGVLARVPLASGFLSDKYQPGQRWGENDVRHGRAAADIDAMLREVAQIRRDEVSPDTDLATWALGWCLKHPAVTTVIPGCKSVEQVVANAAAADLDISPDYSPQRTQSS